MAEAVENPVARSPADSLLFDAVLYPHRSLGPRGFRILMLTVAGVGLALGGAFWLAGAWPVFGFLGVDVLLIYLAFRVSYRRGRLSETIQLTRERLTVRRFSPDGRVQAWDFQPYWLRVEVDRPQDDDARISLASHGRRLVIGAFLSPEERVELASALSEALRRCRCSPAAAG